MTQILSPSLLPKLPPRAKDCHKGQFGHVVVIAGGPGMGGAGLLASQACLRLGAGLVSLATRKEHLGASLSRQPEIMVHAIDHAQDLSPLLHQASVLVIGPGLGQDPWAKDLLTLAASQPIAQLWDADALNLLAQNPRAWPQPMNRILTPHPGEAARLLRCSTKQIQADRGQAATALAQHFQSIVVLKGAQTVIATPQGKRKICANGHPAMAGAGFGDVLGGSIAAFVAQHMTPFDACCLAVYIHAYAGEQCGITGRGVVASDLFTPMRQCLETLCPILPPDPSGD